MYLDSFHGKQRFVLNGCGKRLCHETKEMAWDSFCMRKKAQFRLSLASMERAEFALLKISGMNEIPKESLNLGKPEFWQKYIFE